MSIQTVSRILRGEQARHSAKTCQRVEEAAQKLNYRPNLVGRALQSGKSQTVGLVRLGVGERVQALNLYGMSNQAKAAGYHLLVSIQGSYSNDQDKEFLHTVDDLVGRRVDGLIIHRSVPLLPSTRRYMSSLKVPVAYVSWAPPRAALRAKVDLQMGMKLVLDHLKSLGHEHMAYFVSPGAMDFPGHTILPMQRACMQAGLKLDTVLPSSDFEKMIGEEVWGHDSVTRYLMSRDATNHRATAFVFGGSASVQGGLIALQQASLKVPSDVSVVSMTDQPMAALSKPSITALQCDWEAYGRLIFDTIHQAILQPDKSRSVALVEPLLVTRSSTGPVADEASRLANWPKHRQS